MSKKTIVKRTIRLTPGGAERLGELAAAYKAARDAYLTHPALARNVSIALQQQWRANMDRLERDHAEAAQRLAGAFLLHCTDLDATVPPDRSWEDVYGEPSSEHQATIAEVKRALGLMPIPAAERQEKAREFIEQFERERAHLGAPDFETEEQQYLAILEAWQINCGRRARGLETEHLRHASRERWATRTQTAAA